MAKDPFQDEAPLQPVSTLDSMYYGQQQPEQALAPVPQPQPTPPREPVVWDQPRENESWWEGFKRRMREPVPVETFQNKGDVPSFKPEHGSIADLYSRGLVNKVSDINATVTGNAFKDQKPHDIPEDLQKLLSGPNDWKNPQWYVANISHMMGDMTPTLGAGLVGQRIGGPVGRSMMAALVQGLGSLPQAYQRARSEGLDEEAAKNRALTIAASDAVWTGATFASPELIALARPAKPALDKLTKTGALDAVTAQIAKEAKLPMREALAQIVAVQPALMTGQMTSTSLLEGKGLPNFDEITKSLAMGTIAALPTLATAKAPVMPIDPKKVNNSAGTFLGAIFADDLYSKGIKKPLETLELAKTLETQLKKEGKSPEEIKQTIWQETSRLNMAEDPNNLGWFRGKDGEWRFEVNDQASFNKEGPDVGKLTDSYRNPPVEKAIDLGDITLSRNPKEFGGEYNADFINPEIAVGTRAYTTKTQNPNIFGKEWSPRSVTSHEVQHFIQDVEKWQNGSNPDAILKGHYGPEVESALRNRQLELYKAALEAEPNAKLAPEEHQRAMLDAARKDAAFELYERVAGEVEARNVQKRLDMTPEQRLAKRPELTEDVPREQQILDPNPTLDTARSWVKDASGDLKVAEKNYRQAMKDRGFPVDEQVIQYIRNGSASRVVATTVERLKSNDGTKDLGQGFTLFPVTDKVRQTVQRESQPIFSKKRDKTAMEELREKYKAEEAQRYSPEETAVLTDMWDFVQTMKKVKEPERLSTWLVKEGGLKEYEGELNQLTDRNRRPGLMSQRGKDLDTAAQKAWEEGFLEGAERPTVNDLLNALDDDLRGNHVYRARDAETVADLNQAKQAIEELRDHGIETKADIDRLRAPEPRRSERASEEGVRRTEGQKRSPRQGERVPEQVDIEDIIRRNLPPSKPPPPPGPPADKARIVPSAEKRDPLTFDKFYTAAKDDLHPIRRMEEQLLEGRRGTLAEPDKSPYILSRLTRGLEGRVQQAIRYNMYRFKDMKNVGPGLEKILEPIKMKDRAAFEQYLVYKRTLELENRGIKTGFDPRNAADFVRKNAKQFDAVAKQFTRFAQQGLEYMRDSGMISRDAFTRMTELNKDYAPLYRLMEDGGDVTNLPNTLRNPVKEIKGSERDVISPIESVVRNTYAFIGIAERNRALNAMKDLADANPAVGKALMQRMVNKTEAKQMGHNGGSPLDAEVFKPDTFHPAKDEIVLFRNGERQTYKVEPEVAAAVKNLNREELNWVVKAAAMPARWLRAGATLAPEFIARNPIRDQFSATILSNNNYIPLVSLVEGFVHSIMGGRSPQYQAALKGGGFNANLVSLDRKYINENLMRLQDPTVMGRVKNVIHSPVEALRKMSELMENATRMGEFLQARRAGKSVFNSAYDMREVTLDFARMGAKARAMNAITAFWNANLEGTDRLGRAIWENPRRTAIKALSGIALPSALLWWATRDDERMKEVPKWERDTFWVIPMDDWQPVDADKAATIPKAYKRQIDGQWFQNKGEIIRIPKPFTEGILLGSGTERGLEAMYGNDPKAWKNFGKSIKDAVAPGMIPTGVLPILETSFGKSWFLDRDIVPKYLQRVDPKEQYNPYTSETAKFLGRQVARVDDETSLGSPLVLEHIYRGYTGGLGRLGLETFEKGLELTGVTDKKNWPTNKNADIPLLRAFASRHPSSSAESIQQFYDEYEKREKAKNTAKLLDTRGDTDGARKIREERALANATSTHRQIGALNKEVRRVYDDKKLSPDDKREQIDLLYLKMINLAQKANEMFRATDKKPQSKSVIEDPFKVKIEDPFKQ